MVVVAFLGRMHVDRIGDKQRARVEITCRVRDVHRVRMGSDIDAMEYQAL
jgi:hypothetical protein